MDYGRREKKAITKRGRVGNGLYKGHLPGLGDLAKKTISRGNLISQLTKWNEVLRQA
jgi:hypothetical protein